MFNQQKFGVFDFISYFTVFNMKLACLVIVLLTLASINSQFTTIAIVATNDIHGTAFPTPMQRTDNK